MCMCLSSAKNWGGVGFSRGGNIVQSSVVTKLILNKEKVCALDPAKCVLDRICRYKSSRDSNGLRVCPPITIYVHLPVEYNFDPIQILGPFFCLLLGRNRSQNHRLIQVGRDLRTPRVQSQAQSRVTCEARPGYPGHYPLGS